MAVGAPLVLDAAAVHAQSSKEIAFGVIGTGGRGTAHLRYALQVPGTRLTALCDIKKEQMELALSRVKAATRPALYQDYQELLAHPGLDAVFIATPPYLHQDHFVDALDAGLHVYGEKPLACTVTDCDKIVQTARKAKGIFQIGQQSRNSTRTRTMVKLIHDGLLGDVVFIKGQYHSGDVRYKRWIFSIEQGGDIIVEQAVHSLDRFNWIMDALPERASGLGGQNVYFDEDVGREVMDNYGLVLEYPGGKRVYFTHTWLAPRELAHNYQHVYGSRKAMDMDEGVVYTRTSRGEDRVPPEKLTFEGAPTDPRTLESIPAFVTSIRDGLPAYPDAEIGRTAALTALLGRKAIYEKRVVTWDDLMREGAPVRRIDM